MSRYYTTFARWALLGALVWAVLAMHHVGSSAPDHGAAAGHGMTVAVTHDTEMPSAAPSDEMPPMDLHVLAHLCLAILCAIGGALGLRPLRRLLSWAPSARPATGHHPVLAPVHPPPWGRALLHSVRVLRL